MNADHEPADAPALLLTNPERPARHPPERGSVAAL